jgi:GTP-binding protein
MTPKIAIVGRPNVGKSSLFNRICKKRISIVDEREGITRDRLYGKADLFGKLFEVIDTGGIDASGTVAFNSEIKEQALLAVEEADGIIFVVDGQLGPSPLDEAVAKILRKSLKPIILAVNKTDDLSSDPGIYRFQSLGISEIIPISASQGHMVAELLEAMMQHFSGVEDESVSDEVLLSSPEVKEVRVAIVGRPNVGKSTLLNEILGNQRSIVSPIAGTTRDSIDAVTHEEGITIRWVDTAGIRRKKSEKEVVDKFAAIRTEEAISRADICLLLIDSQEGMTSQEKKIASEIEELGKSCIVLFNKWDLIHNFRMEHAQTAAITEAPFLEHCPILFMSALTGRNVDKIVPAIKEVMASRCLRITTGQLNKFIEGCLQKYHPPLIWGKRLRIYYMTQTQIAPPKFVIFMNNPTLLIDTYKKYLINQFRQAYQFKGTPLVFELRGKTRDGNPELKPSRYKSNKNKESDTNSN